MKNTTPPGDKINIQKLRSTTVHNQIRKFENTYELSTTANKMHTV